MRKSRDETAETRERIVSTASKVFLENGLQAVGLREVMTGAGLTPGGFYRHFESREQLIAEAIHAAFDRLFAMFETQIIGRPPGRALEAIVSIYLQQSQRQENTDLCPLSLIGADLSHCGLQVREAAADGHLKLVQLIATRLPHASKAEALKIASGIVSTMVGAVTLSNITPQKSAARLVLSGAHALIRSHLVQVE